MPVLSRGTARYQLCLKPAEMLLLAMPSGVSAIEPEILKPPTIFCSAPILRSHFSSDVDSVWPAEKLVPVSARPGFADCSVALLVWPPDAGIGAKPWVMLEPFSRVSEY